MIGLVFYAVAAFGLAYIVGHSEITRVAREAIFVEPTPGPIVVVIFEWFRRKFVDLIECPACFGFWTGVFAVVLGAVDTEGFFMAIAWGLFTAGSNYTLSKLTRLID